MPEDLKCSNTVRQDMSGTALKTVWCLKAITEVTHLVPHRSHSRSHSNFAAILQAGHPVELHHL